MRIFILSDPDSIHTKRWVEALNKANLEVFVFGLNSYDQDFYDRLKCVTVFSVDFISKLKNRTSNGSFEKLRYLKAIFLLRKKINEFNPDIIHAHYASSYGLLGALLNIHPYIISVWGSDVYAYPRKSLIHKLVLKFILNRSDCVLSTSNMMKNETNIYTNKNIKVIPFGIDIDLFNANYSDKKGNCFTFGTVKSLRHIYGIDILIESFHKFLQNKLNDKTTFKLCIIGEGEQEQELKLLVKNLGISEHVNFVGKVDNVDLPNYYRMFDVFLALSRSESFGVVALEAMACKCPVILSDAPGFVEVAGKNNCGLIVKRDSIDETCDAMEKLYFNSDLRSEYAEVGRKNVVDNYDWKNNVKQMVDIYSKIIFNEHSNN